MFVAVQSVGEDLLMRCILQSIYTLHVLVPLQEWALGLMHTKCMCGAIWLTNMNFKQTLDQVYQAGVRNLNLTFVLKKVAWPVIRVLSLSIALPYILFMGVFHDIGIYQCACVVVYSNTKVPITKGACV